MYKRTSPLLVVLLLGVFAVLADRADAATATKEQAIWTLSNISNINAGLVESQDDLNKHAQDIAKILSNNTVESFMGSFEIVWGPVIVNKEPLFGNWRTANTMYLAKGVDPETNNPLYVLAVAGTNIVSHYGWFVEDFEVDGTELWPPEALKNDVPAPLVPAHISDGTAAGISILWDMESSGTSLLKCLQNEKFAPNTELAVAGHSLGGALAPTLALALVEAQKKTPWKAGGNVTITTYPTAGPTPGDEAFANLVAHTLGSNYHSTVNTLDVVPHAWQKSTAEKISTLYANLDVPTCVCSGSPTAKGIPDNPVIAGIGYWVVHLPGSTDYERINGNHTFSGPTNQIATCSTQLVDEAKKIFKGKGLDFLMKDALQGILREMTGNKKQKITCDQILTFFQFLEELGYQHTTVYGQHFQIPANVDAVIKKYIDLANADQKAVGTIIYDFVSAVHSYLKQNPPPN